MGKFANKNIYVDNNASSIVAYQVILITVFGIHFQQQWLLILLALDFFLRATGLLISPLYFVAKKITGFLYFEKKEVFGAPKRFAAMLGLAMTILIAFFYDSQIGIFLGIILIALAALESVFQVCIGCYIYNFLIVPIQNKFNNPPK